MVDGGRFVDLSDENLQELLQNRDSKNTKNVIQASISILRVYCQAKDIDFDSLSSITKEKLGEFLFKFFAELRKKDGDKYSRSSMVSIRFGLQRHFQKLRSIDVINDSHFKGANEMFKAVLVDLKKEGKGHVQHKEVISNEDLRKLYESDVFDQNSADGLQCKAFFDIMYFTCRRGRGNLRQMKKTDMVLNTDASGRRYFINKTILQTKNPARMYENPGHERCPVSSLEKYLSKLNLENEWLWWQRPKERVDPGSPVWYDNVPVGHNTLGKNDEKDVHTCVVVSSLL